MNDQHQNKLQELIAGCRQGERHAQKKLYHQFYSYGLTVCLHYIPEYLAEEALHDAFLKVYRSIHQLQDDYAFQPWFRRIVVRVAIDHYRVRKQWFRKKEQTSDLSGLIVENQAISRLATEDIIHLLQQLSPQYRLVFNLFVLEEYSHEEIADLLKISVGTSKSNLARAKQKLRKILRSGEAIINGTF